MLGHGDRVIVAVSGGPDSVALLHLLHRLAPDWGLSLHVFHLDHGLRGEASADDARYVAGLAGELGWPVTVITLPPGLLKRAPGSLQAKARQRRYAEIDALASRIGATKVATGHNRDDQAETVLMRLLRGSGLKGLAGIPPVRRQGGLTLIRPLLAIPRKDIELYCSEAKLFPRLDASNAQADYLRNRIRLELLPLLAREYNPTLGANLAQLAAVAREDDDFLESLAEEAYDRCCLTAGPSAVVLDGARLLAEPLALARRVVRLVARKILGPEADLGLQGVTQVLDAAGKPAGTHHLDLPGGLRLTVEYGRCRFEASAGKEAEGQAAGGDGEEEVWPVSPQGETVIPALGLVILAESIDPGEPLVPGEIRLDANRLPGPLAVRFRRPGDRIWPVGMEGSKKLQDILVDAKVPRTRRGRVPLLASGDELIAVLGHRVDRRYLAGPEADGLIRLRISRMTPE